MAGSPSSVPWVGNGGLRLSMALQNETSHSQDHLRLFGSWGISRIANIPRLTKALKISMTN
jgi:hypothetical protein